MKTATWLLVVAVLFSVLSVPAIAQANNWKHKKLGTSEFSKSRHLSLEVDSMEGSGSYTAASHEVQGLGGTMKDQWARAYYKLEVDSDQNKACDYHEFIAKTWTEDQVRGYINGNLTENCEINLLGAHRYKEDYDISGLTIGDNDRIIVFMYAGGALRSVNNRIKTELHEPACHDGSVSSNRYFHCPTNTCACYAIGHDNPEFCGTTTTGCIKRLRNHVHVD